MWSKLRRKVLKSEGDDKDPNGSVVLKKFDKIPSYVFEPEGDISAGVQPIDWQMALALDNVPPQAPHGSPLSNGRHRGSPQRPLSTFTYSPKLGHRHSLSRDSDQLFYGMDLEGSSLPPCSCAGLESDMCLQSPVHTGTPTHNVISLRPQDHAMLFSDISTDNAQQQTQQANVANGNLSQDESQDLITVSMGITVSMSTPTTAPKRDRKYERVVTNEQVIKEKLNSPQRRKKSNQAPLAIKDVPLAIKDRKCSEETLPSSFSSVGTTGSTSSQKLPVFSTSSAGSGDQVMLPSDPSTANSDNVFELEMQFERQESGYATLDDGPTQVSPAADTMQVMSTIAPVLPSLHCTTITTTATVHAVDAKTPGVISSCHSPISPADNRIYPTFRKQLNSGNNNTTSTTPASSQSASVSRAADAKSNNVDINQNLQNQNRDSSSLQGSQRGTSPAAQDASTQHAESSVLQLSQYLPDPPDTLREHVEYVPADSSVSRIYRKGGEGRRHGNSGEDDLGSSVEDLYASVPKGTQRQSTDEGTATATSSDSSRASSKVDEIEREEDSIGGESEAATEKTDETSGTLVGSDHIIDDLDDEPDDGIDLDIDTDNDDDLTSEDNEVVPPIPEKNYKLLNEGTIMKETVGKRSKGSISSESEFTSEELCEPTHMSWDEVMTEARNLGIPWTKPQSMTQSLIETSPRCHGNDMDRSFDHLDSVSITSLEISSPHPSPAITNTRKQQLANESKPKKKKVPTATLR